jgi:four helix bundle protein
MTAITRFQDIQAWQEARVLVSRIYKASQSGQLARDFGLKDQIQRSAVSIMANIAEGFGRRGRQEFVQFLRIARGSCSEVQSHLYVALDTGSIDELTFQDLQARSETVGRRISAFISYLSNQRTK